MTRLVQLSSRLANSRSLEYFIIGVIIANGLLLGLETSPKLAGSYGQLMHWGNRIALGIFIVEAAIKLLAHFPRSHRYFLDGWNVFDFLVIVFALVPATGQFAMVARLARLLRIVRLVSAVQDLRLIVAALVRSVPSVIHVILLMSIVVYIYAIMGYHLFHEHDPENWRNLGVSILTLFNIITLEGWTEIMNTAMERHPLAWVYFVSFVVVGTFVVINMFVAIIINNLDEAKRERLEELQSPPTSEQLLREIRTTQEALRRLSERLDQDPKE
jgi:voltage-gated sodium channel